MLPVNINTEEAFDTVEFNEESKRISGKIVDAAKYFTMIINSNLYNCAEKTLTIRKVQEAVFWANATNKANQVKRKEKHVLVEEK